MLVLAVVAVVAVLAWVAAKERAPRHRAERQGDARLAHETRRAVADSADAQLARLERTIDAIAIEVERMGEHQRFLTKLLAKESRGEKG